MEQQQTELIIQTSVDPGVLNFILNRLNKV